MPSVWQVRVYYEDTDSGGVVYYANYLRFAERARTEALRAAGIEQAELAKNEDCVFVVRSVQCEYLRPARLDDLLTIETVLQEIGNASLTLQQTIRRGDETLVTLSVRLGVVSAQMRPTRLPAHVREVMMAAFGTNESVKG